MKRLFSLVLMLILALPAMAAKRPMTVEDMIRLKVPAQPVVQPTDERIAYTVSARDLDTNSSSMEVWVLAPKAGTECRLTAKGSHEHSPAWSPDGKTLAFLSNAGGKNQVWTATNPCGAPTKLTDLPTGVSGFKWMPDGKGMILAIRMYPDCGDAACTAKKAAEVAADPVKARVFTELMYRHWDHWRDGRVTHLFNYDIDSGKAYDLMPGNTWGVTGGWDIEPGGRSVVFTTKNPKDEALHTHTELHRAPVIAINSPKRPARPKAITSNPGVARHPVFSPTGKTLAYLTQERDCYESDRLRLTVMDLDGGEPVHLADEVDRWVIDMGWFPSGKKLWFAVMDQGRITVYAVKPRKGAKAKKLLGGAYLSDISLSPNGKRFVYIRQTLSKPMEVFTQSSKGGALLQWSHWNDWLLAEVEMAKVEEVWWEVLRCVPNILI